MSATPSLNGRSEFDRLVGQRDVLDDRLAQLALEAVVADLGDVLDAGVDRVELFSPHEGAGRAVWVDGQVPLSLPSRGIDYLDVRYLWYASIEEQHETEGGWVFVLSVALLRRALEDPTAFAEWEAAELAWLHPRPMAVAADDGCLPFPLGTRVQRGTDSAWWTVRSYLSLSDTSGVSMVVGRSDHPVGYCIAAKDLKNWKAAR